MPSLPQPTTHELPRGGTYIGVPGMSSRRPSRGGADESDEADVGRRSSRPAAAPAKRVSMGGGSDRERDDKRKADKRRAAASKARRDSESDGSGSDASDEEGLYPAKHWRRVRLRLRQLPAPPPAAAHPAAGQRAGSGEEALLGALRRRPRR